MPSIKSSRDKKPKHKQINVNKQLININKSRLTISVLIEFPEQVGNPGFFVIVVFEEPFSPVVPVKVFDLFELLEVVELLLESTITLPSHHPDMTPFFPKSLGPWISIVLLADTSTARIQKKILVLIKNCKQTAVTYLPLRPSGNLGALRSGVSRLPGLTRLQI